MLHKHGRIFRVTLRSPRERASWDIDCGRAPRAGQGVLPEEYDRIALVILETYEKKYPGKLPCERDSARGRVTMRRIFQAPCPVR